MSSEGGEGPPGERPDPPRFPFLKKGTATEKFNGKINFLHQKNRRMSEQRSALSSSLPGRSEQLPETSRSRRSLDEEPSCSSSSLAPFRVNRAPAPLLNVAGREQTNPELVPRLNLDSPTNAEEGARTEKDSGRGSRNSPPDGCIYRAPSHRRADSGLGEDGPPSPHREDLKNYGTYSKHPSTSSQQESDDVFDVNRSSNNNDRTIYSIIPESHADENETAQPAFENDQENRHFDEATVQSLIDVSDSDFEQATDNQSVADSAAFNDNTSQFERIEQGVLLSPTTVDARSKVAQKATLAASDRASLTDYSQSVSGVSSSTIDRRDVAGPSPWTSTPFGSENGRKEKEEERMRAANSSKETGIMQGTPSPVQGSHYSQAPSSNFCMDLTKKTDQSLSDERRFIAPADRPLHEVFPPSVPGKNDRELEHNRENIRPSQLTRYHPLPESRRGRQVSSRQPILNPRVDNLRGRNNRVDKSVQLSREYVSSVDGSDSSNQGLPVRDKNHANAYRPAASNEYTPRPRATARNTSRTKRVEEDSAVQALKRQLRNTIVHLDFSFANMKKEQKKMKSSYEHLAAELENGRCQLASERKDFEQEAEEWRKLKLREQNQLKRDRDALNKREKELDQNMNQRSEQARTTLLKASTKDAELRTKLKERDDKIKDLTEKLNRSEAAKARAERTNNMMKTNHERALKAKDAEIQQLRLENNAATKRNGLASRPKQTPVVDTPPAGQERLPPPILTTPKKQVQFDNTNTVHRFAPDDSYDSVSSAASSSRQNLGKMRVVDTFDRPQKGVCWEYENDIGSEWCQMYRLRHIDGRTVCGAELFQYKNGDVRWIYGPIEVYYYGHTRLQVDMREIGVQIVCFFDQVHIIRPGNEISRYVYGTRELTETRRTKNGKNVYALIFNTKTMERCGNSDRTFQEDNEVLRRGTLHDMREHVVRKDVAVSWLSHHLSTSVTSWSVSAAHVDGSVRIQIDLEGGRGFKIAFYPLADWVLIRHIDPTCSNQENLLCCDMGKQTRDRERAGVYVAAEAPIQRPAL